MFFGRSLNRPGTERAALFTEREWPLVRETVTCGYECHEELVHNPVPTTNLATRLGLPRDGRRAQTVAMTLGI